MSPSEQINGLSSTSHRECVKSVLQRKSPGRVVYAPNYWQWFAHHQNHGLLPPELADCGTQLDLIRHLGLDVFSRNIYADQQHCWFGGLTEGNRLTRHPEPRADGVREVGWDGETVGAWARELEGAEAVVNLCGKSVDCGYTGKNRKLLIESRTLPTRAIGHAIANCQSPPRVWLNSSSATLYKHTLDTVTDEAGAQGATPAAKDAFSIEIIRQWECALNEAQTPRTRKAALRTTMVLGLSRNSVVPVLRRLTRLGLGGRMGSGRQFVSWMHQEDFCRAVEWVIAHDELSGPVIS